MRLMSKHPEEAEHDIIRITSRSYKKGGTQMGDKGGRKGKEKSQKQKTEKHIHDVQAQKVKQQKSSFDIKSR